MRCVEEDVRARKWEKERDLRSRVAELQTEAIRLRRELEVVLSLPSVNSCIHCLYGYRHGTS